MDDFVLRVKQVAQYQFATTAGATDAILLQTGGLGGSYAYTNPAGIVGPFTDPLQTQLNTLQLQLSGFNQILADYQTAWTEQFTNTISAISANSVWSFNGRQGNVNLGLFDITCVGGAPINSPGFTGTPTAPDVADPCAHDWQIANTAFVQAAIAKRIHELLYGHPLVFSFNGRSGNVTLLPEDIEQAYGALLDSPVFTGIPTTPTPPAGDNSLQIANTEWVYGNFAPIDSPALTGIPTAPTAAITVNSTQIATTAFVNNLLASELTNWAPLASPQFSGIPTAPTANPGTSTAQLATTAFVMAAVAESVAGVATFNTRTGNVVMDGSDITAAGGALLASPAFTGSPTAPTQATGTSNTTLATTGFVMNEVAAIDAGVVTFNNRSGAVTFLLSDVTGVGGAPISSPSFSGVPLAATASPGTNTTQIATTAFVTAAVSGLVSSFNGRGGAVTLTANDVSAAGGLTNPSAALTGVPTAPTAATGVSTTQIATTAFVQAALAGANVVSSFNGRNGAVNLTAADVNAAGGPYLPLTGGIMTGALGITSGAGGSSLLSLDKPASGLANLIYGQTAGNNRWVIQLGNTDAETGSGNLGSNVQISNCSDAGTPLQNPLIISRSTAVCTFSQPIVNGSDRRLKENVTPISDALMKVEALTGVSFNRIGQTNREIGFIAQDVRPVVPEVVQETSPPMVRGQLMRDGGEPYLGLNYAQLTALLVEAIKTLAARLTALEATPEAATETSSASRSSSRKRKE